MKKLIPFLFLFTVTVSPLIDENGKVVRLDFTAPSAALGGQVIEFSLTPADTPLELDAQGDLKNKATVKAVAKAV